MSTSGDVGNVAALAAPQLFGGLFNWCLYGSLVVQFYIYYMTSASDRHATKTLVYGIFLIETVQSCLVAHDLYEAYAAEWGLADAFEAVRFEWLDVPLMTAVVSTAVQLFYTWRIYILGHSKILVVVLSSLAVTQGVAGIVVGAQTKLAKNFQEVQADTYDAVLLWHIASALCDILITISMMIFLSKSRTGFRRTDKILTGLMRVTLETGLITAAAAVVDLVLFLALKHSNYYEIPAYILSKLYSNNLFVLINNRVRMITSKDAENETSLELKSIPVSVTRGGTQKRSSLGDPIRTRLQGLLPLRPARSRPNNIRQGDGHAIRIHVEEDIFRDGSEHALGLKRPSSSEGLSAESRSTKSSLLGSDALLFRDVP